MKTEKNDSDAVDSQDVKVDDAEDAEVPKYGPLRRLSQKLQQLFLTYPSSYAVSMICISALKLFVQVFDIWTDVAICNFLILYFSRGILLLLFPLVSKIYSKYNFIKRQSLKTSAYIFS